MSTTAELIQDLKSRVNPATGKGFDYDEIGALLGMTKQAASQNIHDKRGRCPKCLRRWRRAPKLPKV